VPPAKRSFTADAIGIAIIVITLVLVVGYSQITSR
jgi:hypothetical protein